MLVIFNSLVALTLLRRYKFHHINEINNDYINYDKSILNAQEPEIS